MIKRFIISLITALPIYFASYFANSATFDMRDCALNNIIFIDPWAGDQFVTQHVGTSYYYLCGDDWKESV